MNQTLTALAAGAVIFAMAPSAFATSAPEVFTNSPWDVTASSATMGGWVNPRGSQATAWIEYGTSPAFGQTLGHQQIGNTGSANTIQVFASGLQPNTTYYYRIVAQNSIGTSQGSTLQFTTRQGFGQTYQTSYQNPYTASQYYQSQYQSQYQYPQQYSYPYQQPQYHQSGYQSYGEYPAYAQGTYQPAYPQSQPAYYGQGTYAPAVSAAPRTTAAPKKATTTQTVSKLGDIVTLSTLIDRTDAEPGDEIVWKAVYKNVSTNTIEGLTLTAVLPQSVEFISADPKAAEQSGQTLLFNVGTLKPQTEGAVSVKTKMRESNEPVVFTALLGAPTNGKIAGAMSSQRSLTGGGPPDGGEIAGGGATSSAASNKSFLASVAETLGRIPDYVWFIVLVLVLTFLYFAYQYFWGREEEEWSGEGERITIQTAR